jgi:uncharacterized repeat protein (TIGR03809 family)
MVQATVNLERVALKWRELAERRRNHFVDLYRSGRWRHYYSSEEFLSEMNEAVALAQRWAKIAPRREEPPQAAGAAKSPAAAVPAPTPAPESAPAPRRKAKAA